MATMVARSGLTHSDLKIAADRKGEEGLTLLLQEQRSTGNARVTSPSKVVDGLVKHCSPPQEPMTPLTEITNEKLALFRKRRNQRYDLPDA